METASMEWKGNLVEPTIVLVILIECNYNSSSVMIKSGPFKEFRGWALAPTSVIPMWLHHLTKYLEYKINCVYNYAKL